MRYILSVVALSALLASPQAAYAQGNLTIDVSGVPGTNVTSWTFSGSYVVGDVSPIPEYYSTATGTNADDAINNFTHESGELNEGIGLARTWDSVLFPFVSSTAQVVGSQSGVHMLDGIVVDSDDPATGDDLLWFAGGTFEDGETVTFSGTATIALDISLFLAAGDTSRSISSAAGGPGNTPADFFMNFTLASDNPNIKVAAILESLRILETNGDLSGGLENALSAKLDAVLRQLEQQPQAATGMLTAFIHEVTALVQAGRLTAADGQNLITAAESVIADLSDQP
jgi:hypothetical protein